MEAIRRLRRRDAIFSAVKIVVLLATGAVFLLTFAGLWRIFS